ncbi:hypothetical protein A2U01_0099986, partial [Trifolium medium]|nr:hypothetical protein [Trifolium medium]
PRESKLDRRSTWKDVVRRADAAPRTTKSGRYIGKGGFERDAATLVFRVRSEEWFVGYHYNLTL